MVESVFSPLASLAPVFLRVAIGIVFLVHGLPKLNPSSPMKGPARVAAFYKQLGVPIPGFFAWVVALLETAGALLLILGIATRVLGILFAVEMLVAIWAKIARWKLPFMAPQSTGWELDFTLLAASISLVMTGPGTAAVGPSLGP